MTIFLAGAISLTAPLRRLPDEGERGETPIVQGAVFAQCNHFFQPLTGLALALARDVVILLCLMRLQTRLASIALRCWPVRLVWQSV